MGRFKCVQCTCCYYDLRFAWESAIQDQSIDVGVAAVHAQTRAAAVGASYDPQCQASDDSCSLVRKASAGSLSDASTQDGSPCASDNGSLWDDSIAAEVSCAASLPQGDGQTTQHDNAALSTAKARMYADMMRAMGFVSDASGTFGTLALHVSVVCRICSRISVVADSVEVTSGVVQLMQGLCTPSGFLDPHLATKGGVIIAFGGGSLVVASLASISPILFVVALCLGAAGLATTAAVDATMDGLCPGCRCGDQRAEIAAVEVAKESSIVRAPRHPTRQYEMTELLAMWAFGFDW